MKHITSFTEFINENNKEVYYNSYSAAITTALEYATKAGYEYSEDDVWSKISMGDKRPKDGVTNKFTITLYKNGKEQKKALQIQVYGMGDKYELNVYIS